MSEPIEHDILIAGGGMAGASLAMGLAGQGWKVAVIEAVARSADHQPSYDERTLVLNAASLCILDKLGIADGLEPCPIREIVITRAGGFGRVVLRAAEEGVEHFGAVILGRKLGNHLIEVLADEDRITEYCPERLETLRVDDDRVSVRLQSGRQLAGRLLVAADGTGSMVRQAAGIVSRSHDYGQSAMIFNVRPGRHRPNTAFERFTADGPMAFVPLTEGRLGAIWVAGHQSVDKAMEWSDEELLERLEERAGPGFGGFSNPGRRVCYPLKLLRTEIPIARRVVAIGNAANTVHPVSAQGLNLGLRDVAGLLDVLDGCRDPGAPALLAQYVQRRRRDQAATVRYTDTLARAFTNPSGLFRHGTGFGLAAFAFLPALRRRLVRAGMGFREPVSRLARSEP